MIQRLEISDPEENPILEVEEVEVMQPKPPQSDNDTEPTLSDVLIEGPHPSNDEGYFIIKDEPNQYLSMIEKGIPVMDFCRKMKRRKTNMEYRLLRRLTETQYHVAALVDYDPDLADMNRYKNIVPYKHSLIKMPEFQKHTSKCYINANFVNGIFRNHLNNVFIATQGPLENSCANFWRCVWTQKSELVIMLCRLKKFVKGDLKRQCYQYWPTDINTSVTYEEFRITLLEEEKDGLFVKRRLRITLLKTPMSQLFNPSQSSSISNSDSSDSSENEKPQKPLMKKLSIEEHMSGGLSKDITQIQWVGWPDHGVPNKTDYPIIENLLAMITDQRKVSEAPIVIHCSAGVGRTGTLICMYLLQEQFKFYKQTYKEASEEERQKYRFSIFGLVRRVREQRWGMVNTPDQYRMLYKYLFQKIKDYMMDIEEWVELTPSENHSISEEEYGGDLEQEKKIYTPKVKESSQLSLQNLEDSDSDSSSSSEEPIPVEFLKKVPHENKEEEKLDG